jgi:hypothetical protein
MGEILRGFDSRRLHVRISSSSMSFRVANAATKLEVLVRLAVVAYPA